MLERLTNCRQIKCCLAGLRSWLSNGKGPRKFAQRIYLSWCAVLQEAAKKWWPAGFMRIPRSAPVHS